MENLGKPIPPTSKYYPTFMKYRHDLQRMIICMTWTPSGIPMLAMRRPLDNLRLQLQQQDALRKAVLDAEYKLFVAKQLQEMAEQMAKQAQEQAKQAEELQRLLRELARQDGAVILNKLQDKEPMTRWLAVLVASKKRMPVEEYLIDLLADKHSAVRQAAHQALMRIGRSTDFGPPPSANTKQIAQAQTRWRNWLQTQVETRLTEGTQKSGESKR